MTNKNLVLFDCDGTLVDTEYLSSAAYAAGLHQISDDLKIYNAQNLEDEFKGMKFSASANILIERHNLSATIDDITAAYMNKVIALRSKEQRHIAGAKDGLAKLAKDTNFEICVASNGEFQNILASLEFAELLQYFPIEKIFNAAMVEQPKPSPLLFEHAAVKCGFKSSGNIVIEDSVPGVIAGKAAGNFVYGITVCAHDKEQEAKALKQAGADVVFDSFIHIIDDILLNQTDGCRISA